ncbi:retron Ec48 family effector membrane protein [Pseudoalteromonas distincta]|uniref:retron Ec48 family effector membrane protein n=1 Tax=Pseudoalteromonas distincta TaxID=77608 RepID=UPI0039EC0397
MKINSSLNPHRLLSRLILCFKFITVIGLIILVLMVASTFYSIANSEYQTFTFCFKNECVNNTINTFSGAIKFFSGLIFILTSIATIGGIFIALMGYINNHQSNMLNNHISHFSLFKEYLKAETLKRDRLSLSAFDVFKWYNLIFENSRTGSMNISKTYISLITEVNRELDVSNKQSQQATEGSFYYKKHQYRVINVLKKLGVILEVHPRNDFYEIEGQLLSLISSINNEFCACESIPKLNERKYI